MRAVLSNICLFLAVCAPQCQAGTIDAIYSFGDSLSDTGNAFLATSGTTPGSPYYAGRFSNGPIWIDDLAASLGLTSTPSLLGGTNFAVGSAETGATPVHPTAGPADLLSSNGQIASFALGHPVADPNALYTIWIGSNDLDDVLLSSPTTAQLQTDIGAIVANIDTAITDLAGLGARNFLVVTVPDLGKIPAATAAGPAASAAASAVSGAFDSTLVNGGGPLPSLAGVGAANGVNIQVLDTYSLLDAIVAGGASLGFSNTTDPCLTGEVNYSGGTPCSPNTAVQNGYVFWDSKHPTSAAHAIVAADALAIVTPEPASWMLAGAGLLAIAGWRRRLGA